MAKHVSPITATAPRRNHRTTITAFPGLYSASTVAVGSSQ